MILLFVLTLATFVALIGGALLRLFEACDCEPFKDRWPPIDDDEFMRRCPPGTRREVAIRVRAIVAKQLGVEYERVYPEQNFVKDLGCD